MLQSSRNQNISYEKQTKFIQDRITSVEKNFSEICSAFGAYARKVARLRDTGDELAKVLHFYANAETVNKSLSSALDNLATTFSAIEDYRNAYVQRLEIKVITELSQYEGICRHARGEVKHTLSVRDSEIARKRVLDRVKERNPLSKQQIMQAEAELLKASSDMSRTSKELEEQTDLFEKHKLEDIKTILRNFIEMEMVFHSKSLELLTVAHHQVVNINESADLKEFRAQLSAQSDQKLIQKHSGHGSLASLLGQREKGQSKSLNSMDSLRTLSENSDDEDDAESSDEKSSPRTHRRSNSSY